MLLRKRINYKFLHRPNENENVAVGAIDVQAVGCFGTCSLIAFSTFRQINF